MPIGPLIPIGAGIPPRPGTPRIGGGDRMLGIAGAEAMLAGGAGRGMVGGVPLALGALGVSVVRGDEDALKSFETILSDSLWPFVLASPLGLAGASPSSSGVEGGLSAGEDI